MASKVKLSAVGSAVGILMLILDGRTALIGAREGIELCLQTVIPSLFPFFVLSPLLISGMNSRWLRPVGRLCKIPKGAEALLLVGFLGGYPTGAQCIAQSCRNGQISKPSAQRMMAFCNNAGPSFLFGMVGQMFPHPGYTWLLWGIHVVSAVLVGMILPSADTAPTAVTVPTVSLPKALKNAVHTMALVCGWVVFFRIGIGFLNRWILWLLPEMAQIILMGILELSNGCCALGKIEAVSVRFLVCSGMLAFGGICVILQTRSVTEGLSMKIYFPGKLLQTGISLLFAYTAQQVFPDSLPFTPLVLLFLIPFLLRFGKREINSSIPQSVGV